MNFLRNLCLLAVFGLWLQASTKGQQTDMNQDWSKLDFATVQRLIEGANAEAQLSSIVQALRHQSPEIQLLAAKKLKGKTSGEALNTFVTVFDEQPTVTTGGTESYLIHRQFLRQLIVNMAVAIKRADQDGDEQWEKSVLQEARASTIGAVTPQKDQGASVAPTQPDITSPLPSASLPPTTKAVPTPKPTRAPDEEPPSSTPWSVIVTLIVAAGGLLWLLLKRRS